MIFKFLKHWFHLRIIEDYCNIIWLSSHFIVEPLQKRSRLAHTRPIAGRNWEDLSIAIFCCENETDTPSPRLAGFGCRTVSVTLYFFQYELIWKCFNK